MSLPQQTYHVFCIKAIGLCTTFMQQFLNCFVVPFIPSLHRRSMAPPDTTQQNRKEHTRTIELIPKPLSQEAYFNERLAPENYRSGLLSSNPATRLRQMLARPGIVVRFSARSLSLISMIIFIKGCTWNLRRHQCQVRFRGRF
jgi:hypothetical protein